MMSERPAPYDTTGTQELAAATVQDAEAKRLRALLLPLVQTDPAYYDDATRYRCAYCPGGVHSHDHHPACAWRIAADAMGERL